MVFTFERACWKGQISLPGRYSSWGVLFLGGTLPGGYSSWGVLFLGGTLPGGYSSWGGILPGGYLSGGLPLVLEMSLDQVVSDCSSSCVQGCVSCLNEGTWS